MSLTDQDRLCAAATNVARGAYAPYSNFRVGAALLCGNGEVITGVNIENRSYGLTICAERSASAAAISAGKSVFKAIAIAGLDCESPVPPCGACRQVLSEFLAGDAPVYFSGSSGNIVATTISELLPYDSLYDLKRRR